MTQDLKTAIQRAAREDEMNDGAWIRILAIAVLRKRGLWPGHSSEPKVVES